MVRYLRFLVFLFPAAVCLAQQKILLVGTLHQTAKERLSEIIPIASAVQNFDPEIICVEYPIATDTATVKYKGGEETFLKKEALQKEWNVGANMSNKIKVLQKDPYLSSDIKKKDGASTALFPVIGYG